MYVVFPKIVDTQSIRAYARIKSKGENPQREGSHHGKEAA